MKVVQVSAQRDYEGTVWTALFSNVEQALEVLRNQPADVFAGVNDLDIAWVGVNDGSYDRVDQFEVKFEWGDPDTVKFRKWISNDYVEVKL